MAKKTKNPLYVVTQKGGVVEEAANYFDAIVKKFGLTTFIDYLETLINFVKENIKGYIGLEIIINWYNEFYEFLLKVTAPFAKVRK